MLYSMTILFIVNIYSNCWNFVLLKTLYITRGPKNDDIRWYLGIHTFFIVNYHRSGLTVAATVDVRRIDKGQVLLNLMAEKVGIFILKRRGWPIHPSFRIVDNLSMWRGKTESSSFVRTVRNAHVVIRLSARPWGCHKTWRTLKWIEPMLNCTSRRHVYTFTVLRGFENMRMPASNRQAQRCIDSEQ